MKSLIPLLLFFFPLIGLAEKPPTAPLRSEMHKAFSAYEKLQPYLYQRSRFLDAGNEQTITGLIAALAKNFHSVEEMTVKNSEPAFSSTLSVLNDMLYDSLHRFKEGKKEYALWRLRTASTYCITCHTRYESTRDFFTLPKLPANLSPLEKGEILLASRQFQKAAEAFLEAAIHPKFAPQRMLALRAWLLIYVRVKPEPKEAIATLQRISLAIKPTQAEKEEIDDWIGSLEQWVNEPGSTKSTLAEAEELLEKGLHAENILEGKRGTVDLLRATSLLHSALDAVPPLTGQDRAKALYLLGVAYRQLPLFFANELPELLLEQCIREAPGTAEAKRAFRLYQEIINLGYTGSGGTNLPDDVLLQLQELHNIAYGIPALGAQVQRLQ